MEKTFNANMPTLGINVPQLENVGSVGASLQGQGLIAQLSDILGRSGNVINNISVNNKFDKIETSQYALHKANLELKRIIGG